MYVNTESESDCLTNQMMHSEDRSYTLGYKLVWVFLDAMTSMIETATIGKQPIYS